jgi:anti-anti-sigma factor
MAEFKTVGERLTIVGPLDGSAQAELRSHCRKLLDSGAKTVELDLSRVEQIASVCIGSIVAFWIDLRPAGIRLKIMPSPAVKRVLELTGLADVFARAARQNPPGPAA